MIDHITPSRELFKKLAKRGNVIPVTTRLLGDLETPVSAYLKQEDRPYSYLLESAENGERMGRYSILGASHSMVFESRNREIKIIKNGREEKFQTPKDPLFELEKLLKQFKQVELPGLPPFSGGAVGYFGYENIRFFEKIPLKNKTVHDVPDSVFIFSDSLCVFDHFKKMIHVIANVCVDDFNSLDEAYDYAVSKVREEVSRLQSQAVSSRDLALTAHRKKIKVESNFSKPQFMAAVQKAKKYIRIGDIFQVVISRMFKVKTDARPFDVYRMLRCVNPSPYMFFLNFKTFCLAGSSPETHVKCIDRVASLRPIAGTILRDEDPVKDRKNEEKLLADPKERAEHLMLVDLGRNDLGRVCRVGSVKVPEFMVIERYSHVMHIVSDVKGELDKKKTVFDLLRATFPAGTVSGAPKVRAMEIIDELENQKRAVYSGVVGYFGYSGNFDSCIAIRTLLLKDGYAYAQAGAGIVADSVPANEYQETLNKAQALLKTLEMV